MKRSGQIEKDIKHYRVMSKTRPFQDAYPSDNHINNKGTSFIRKKIIYLDL